MEIVEEGYTKKLEYALRTLAHRYIDPPDVDTRIRIDAGELFDFCKSNNLGIFIDVDGIVCYEKTIPLSKHGPIIYIENYMFSITPYVVIFGDFGDLGDIATTDVILNLFGEAKVLDMGDRNVSVSELETFIQVVQGILCL